MIPRILIIAGSDSGGGAGIQADIKTVTMLGGHAMTAITAITAQNTLGVQAVMAVPTEMVLAQIDSCVSDIGVDAVKIGMIGSAETAHAVAERLERLDVPIVFDPVMVATSGSVLADAATIAAFERLMAIATVVTPNVPELEVLVGYSLPTEGEGERAATELAMRLGCAILAKGGHRPPENTGQELDIATGLVGKGLIADCLALSTGQTMAWTHQLIPTRHTHGTGCTLASAIAVGLARNVAIDYAVGAAVKFVQAALTHAPGLGQGSGPMGHAMGRVPFDQCPA
jgi:hydroxymethylpyrimidine/phosphomethylpyrimidine kinase